MVHSRKCTVCRRPVVAYLERKKTINIEEKPVESEYQYLRKEAVKIFSIDESIKPHQLIFQRFDPEWGEYIDVDDGDDFGHKDKLKLIVIGLSDDVPSATSSHQSCETQCLDRENVAEVEVDIPTLPVALSKIVCNGYKGMKCLVTNVFVFLKQERCSPGSMTTTYSKVSVAFSWVREWFICISCAVFGRDG